MFSAVIMSKCGHVPVGSAVMTLGHSRSDGQVEALTLLHVKLFGFAYRENPNDGAIEPDFAGCVELCLKTTVFERKTAKPNQQIF